MSEKRNYGFDAMVSAYGLTTMAPKVNYKKYDKTNYTDWLSRADILMNADNSFNKFVTEYVDRYMKDILIEDLWKRIHDLEAKLEDSHRVNRELQEMWDKLNKENLENLKLIDGYDSDAKVLVAKNNDLETCLKSSRAVNDGLRKDNFEKGVAIQNLSEENEELKKTVNEMKKESERGRAAYNIRVSDDAITIKKLREENKKLKERLDKTMPDTVVRTLYESLKEEYEKLQEYHDVCMKLYENDTDELKAKLVEIGKIVTRGEEKNESQKV